MSSDGQALLDNVASALEQWRDAHDECDQALASVAAVQSQLEALSEMGDVPSGSRYTRPLWPCTSGNKVFSA